MSRVSLIGLRVSGPESAPSRVKERTERRGWTLPPGGTTMDGQTTGRTRTPRGTSKDLVSPTSYVAVSRSSTEDPRPGTESLEPGEESRTRTPKSTEVGGHLGTLPPRRTTVTLKSRNPCASEVRPRGNPTLYAGGHDQYSFSSFLLMLTVHILKSGNSRVSLL